MIPGETIMAVQALEAVASRSGGYANRAQAADALATIGAELEGL